MNINRAAYEELLPRLRSVRAQRVLRTILDKGGISTWEIEELGYSHPPRAAQDLKEAGVALRTVFGERHPETGNRMGTYVLAAPEPITEANFTGRAALPKKLADRLYDHYGVRCNLDSHDHGRRALQADHRIPYIIGGDPERFDVADWQLLCGSHQRLKSFECESCPNLSMKDPEVCATCFWAFPESYQHVATRPMRRTDLAWGEREMVVYDALARYARGEGLAVTDAAKRLIADRLGVSADAG